MTDRATNPKSPPIALVVAMGDNREIGHGGTMPWHLPADLKHFKTLTMGHTVLMGRRTFESIGRALPGRENFVVSRDPAFRPADCRVFATLEQALAAAPQRRTLMVIGGATLYNVLLPRAQTIYLTRVRAHLPADTWFPEIAADAWREAERTDHAADARNPYPYSFVTLERIRPD